MFYTDEQKNEARNTDMMQFLAAVEGFDFKRCGKEYHCIQHDSLVIKSDCLTWYWNSRCICGRNAIDWCVKVRGMSFRAAMQLIVGKPEGISSPKRKTYAKTPVKSSPCKSLVVKNEILLFGDEFADLNGWNVDMAFSEEDEDIKAFSNSPVKKLRLKDAATVFRGKAVNAKAESGNVAVINISNITDTGIDYEHLDQIEEEERKVSRYILEDGDVLVTARGTTVKIAVFEKQPMICIPSANINVIRPKDMLRGAYLKLFLAVIYLSGMRNLQLRQSHIRYNLSVLPAGCLHTLDPSSTVLISKTRLSF